MIASALDRWPALRQYASTARVERVWVDKDQMWRDAVIVTVKEARTK